MSVIYCQKCDKQIDLDYDVEHFEDTEHQMFRAGEILYEMSNLAKHYCDYFTDTGGLTAGELDRKKYWQQLQLIIRKEQEELWKQ